MAPDQHCVFFVCRVLNDGNAKRVVVAKIASLFKALTKALDLLNVVDAELTHVFRTTGTAARLEDQSHEDGPMAVRVNAATSTTLGEGGQE
ncbi:hypothetical protein PpBr36_01128 [Pyricularia pennisetigena]|uniref:hypothetical protein n=1 Tax=Pyricularia pennisetigena TaxID=1578925 RepID=UPI0011501FBF|nr:hypothetical protein PpBr36_01128 [Pyricularia pennisetigena]TLS28483.1 hypothetical protein PpBr36_01128 [Pyricularia pennisetigena]